MVSSLERALYPRPKGRGFTAQYDKTINGLTVGVLNKCIEEAISSDFKLKVGAVIFKGKRIISSGHNGSRHCRIHPRYQDYPNSLHAEQDALIGMDWNNVRGCNIIVIRVNPSGKLAESRPCDKCYELLKYVGIKKVYYSLATGEIQMSPLEDLDLRCFHLQKKLQKDRS